MKRIIEDIIGKLKIEIEEFVEGSNYSIDEAERYFMPRIKETVLALMAGLYEERDNEMRADKAGRKAAGLSIERIGDERSVLTRMGELRFRRTYYKKASGGYEYPVDEEAGLEAYQRMSTGVGLALVENAAVMSYGKTSELVTGGQVSRQSVMNKVRLSYPKKYPVIQRKVPVLHIDADEDHVALQSGGSTIVPLISGYEGIKKKGKRSECVNIFHYSEYGRTPTQLWEAFYDELDWRYDLYKTKIYLHGDGANWIQTGRDYLPNCTFVLDRYHVNSAIKQATAGFDAEARKEYLKTLTEAEISGDRERYAKAVKSICLHGEERNAEAARYLLNFPRPYEKYDITPIFPKNTVGKSFPSRHTASAAVIAGAFLYVSLPLGAVFLVIALLIAASRVVGGVHFTRDVAAGVLYALLCSAVYFL